MEPGGIKAARSAVHMQIDVVARIVKQLEERFKKPEFMVRHDEISVSRLHGRIPLFKYCI